MIVLLINLSLCFPSNIAARFYLFFIGACFYLGGIASSITWAGLGWKLSIAASILGFTSVMWVAIRPKP